MKRTELLKYIRKQGCEFLIEKKTDYGNRKFKTYKKNESKGQRPLLTMND